VHRGSVLDINANFDNNSFEVNEIYPDGTEGATWISTQRGGESDLRDKRKKFFLLFSSCGSHRITLLSSY
jgi:hypothetical protein